ncbi:ABC transporter ATP-binding protein/permease [Nocardia sp. NPDC003693]
MARPVDPRLWRYARSARTYLALSVALSLAITMSIVVAALALARVLAGVITDATRRDIGSWRVELVVFTVAVLFRAAATWWQARLAHRAGARVVAELETAVLTAGAQLPPRELESRRTELAVVVGSGLSGLRAYLAGYLPALLLSLLVPPILLAVIAAHDWISGAIILVTLPLIPIFMILIGLLTKGRAEQTLAATTRLSDQLLDLFAGMPTLRALGRESGSDGAAAAPTAPHRYGDPAPRRGRAIESTIGPDAETSAMSDRTTMRHRVRRLGDDLHRRTMSALRIAFLSSMVLEALATLSVALVAVSIGLRLVYGEMGLYAGLLALILAPDVYLPLRAVGERFHAAQDGMAAAEKAFAILEPGSGADESADGDTAAVRASAGTAGRGSTGPAGQGASGTAGRGSSGTTALRSAGPAGRGSAGSTHTARVLDGSRALGTADAAPAPAAASDFADVISGADPASTREPDGHIVIRGLSVAARDGLAPHALSGTLRRGAVTVLTGPNGSGKSTALQAILGLVAPAAGTVLVDGVPVPALDPDHWWSQVAWLPQRPVLVPGTLRDNIELLGPPADAADLEDASRATGFDTVLAELPDGWNTRLGPGGTGLSLGQRQRLALTRTLAADRAVLLLDEPTAHLDPASEARVLRALRARAAGGATVVLVAHRPALLAIADEVLTVTSSGGDTETVAAHVATPHAAVASAPEGPVRTRSIAVGEPAGRTGGEAVSPGSDPVGGDETSSTNRNAGPNTGGMSAAAVRETTCVGDESGRSTPDPAHHTGESADGAGRHVRAGAEMTSSTAGHGDRKVDAR